MKSSIYKVWVKKTIAKIYHLSAFVSFVDIYLTGFFTTALALRWL